ncbi:tetratricopeptide repeat protein [Parvularcula flava]|uniref:Tetratricopeptide repeat protein n=1 Tax=Aquisalinus luteolus TaxID=1566827 RepID=A0ABX0HL63_9PROT|nr:tetratricopeptide repeat protein [Aquisalinus luteolus]NHK28758.1 tetratricopeptide repeat protein [Aquisalinus luteolus]
MALGACASPGGSSGYIVRDLQEETVVGDYLKARFAANQQQLDIAADAYARASEAAPQDALLLRHAFFYELAAGDVGASATLARQLNQPEFRTPEASAEDGGEAIRQALEAARAQQNLSLPVLTVAADQMASGDYAEALVTLEAEADSSYVQSISYLMRAWALFETEGADAGLAMLDNTQAQAFTGFTPLHKALMLEAAGRRNEARTAYAAAAKAYPAEQTRIAQAYFLERTGSKDEARALYRGMVEEDGVLVRTGRLGLIRLGEPLAGETDLMIREAKRFRVRPFVRSGADGAGLALYHFAWATYRQALSEQAAAYRAGFTNLTLLLNTPLAFAQLSAHLNEDFDAVNYLVGGIYNSYEMYEDAARLFGEVSFNDSFYEYAVTDRASALVQMEKTDKALSLLQEYVARDAYAVSTALRLANLLSDDGQYQAAEQTLTSAIDRIEQRPEDERGGDLWRYYFSRGVLHADMDQWVQAEADLVMARELSDDEPYVLNYLGYSWVERGENLEEAFAMIEEALRQEPNSGAITDSLGWAHYQLGEYQEAIDYLERAVELEPADPVITDHLGDAYWQVSRRNEARYEWRRALSYDPDDDLRVVIERKLAEGEIITADSSADRTADIASDPSQTP